MHHPRKHESVQKHYRSGSAVFLKWAVRFVHSVRLDMLLLQD